MKQSIIENLSTIRAFLVEVLLLISISAGVIALLREITRNPIILAPIEGPGELRKIGYTPKVLAERLQDEAIRISQEAKENARKEIVYDWKTLDITVPGAQISFNAVIGYLRQLLGLTETHISGDLTQDAKLLRLTLRRDNSKANPEILTVSNNDLTNLIIAGGQSLLQLTDPYTLASYFYAKESKSKDLAKTTEALTYCLERAIECNHSKGHYLKDIIYYDSDRYEDAIAQYRKSIELEPRGSSLAITHHF